MSEITKSIVVDVPLQTAYNQWTQFEDFPVFMEGVKSVAQITDKKLKWKANIGGKEKEWEAEITEQVPDERIAWRNATGAKNAGDLSFRAMGDYQTEITLHMVYDPEGAVESLGDMIGIVSGRIEKDLYGFKQFIEKRQVETVAWRGSIPGGGSNKISGYNPDVTGK